MRSQKKLLFILCLFFPILTFAQTATIKGTVTDESNRPVNGAKISIKSSGHSTTTDSTGAFILQNVPYGKMQMDISKDGISSTNKEIEVKEAEVNVAINLGDQTTEGVHASSESIPTVSLNEEELKESSTPSVASVLTASRDAFVSATTFVFSVARFRVRGYDDENFYTLMNSAPMNDMVTGRNLYSSWTGLNDVMRSRESTYGLHPATYSFGALGGVTSIDSRASHQRKQFQISYSASNRSYDNRVMATWGSGVMKGGWAVSLSYSRRWADEGYVKGTFYDGHSYFLSVEKIINSKHSLSLTGFGAMTKNGRSAPASKEMMTLADDHYYNPNWGYQNGKVRNAVVGDAHQPVIILNHDWKINEKSSLESALSYQFGLNKVSGLDWYNAEDPRPDYYRYLPSFDPNYGEDSASYNAYSAQLADLLRNNESLRQIQWDELYEANQLHDTTINGTSGLWAKYVIQNRVTDTKRANFNTIYNRVINDHLVFNGGATFQSQSSEYYKEVKDLMGADFFTDLNQFAQQANPLDPNANQNDLDNPNRILHEGDKYGYDYTAHIAKGSLWGQGVFTYNRVDFFLALNLANTSFYRTGHVRNGVFATSSFGDSEKKNFFTYAVKGGVTYKANGRNYFFVNLENLSRAPLFDNAFISPRTRNTLANDLKNESIFSVEGGYLLKSPRLKGKAVAYMTQYTDGTDTRSFYDDDYRTFVNYTLTGIDKRHVGIEVAVDAALGKGFSASAVASVGEFFYSSRPLATTTQDNKDTLLGSNETLYLEDLHLGGGAQSAYTVGLNYRSKRFWFVNVNFNYFDDIYIDANPRRRSISSLDLVDAGSTTWKAILQQEKADPQFTMDASFGWSWRMNNKIKSLKRPAYIVLNLGLTNILNNQDLINGGYEYSRFDTQNKDVNKFPNKYTYSYGTTFFANLTLRFN
ncbi:MAG: TonB-dependent receptor [Bacteroidetes bacterium]|nr:TonB-dependent receptor [Bacteroidota bacterium]MBL0137687.1 TonB-dependent receptor [Bacteroidota bacterium]